MNTEIAINQICYTCACTNKYLVCVIRGKVDANDSCKYWEDGILTPTMKKILYERREVIRAKHF